jgi:hypothetical protein
MRFVTLADIGAEWRIVREHLQARPEHRDYGISFIAVLRHRRFTIDDRELTLRSDNALAQWWAYVTTADRGVADTTMSSVLTLGFWIPDEPYAAYMRSKGHHAAPGDVRFSRDPAGGWRGLVSAAGLRVEGSAAQRPQHSRSKAAHSRCMRRARRSIAWFASPLRRIRKASAIGRRHGR